MKPAHVLARRLCPLDANIFSVIMLSQPNRLRYDAHEKRLGAPLQDDAPVPPDFPAAAKFDISFSVASELHLGHTVISL
jgi:hypothetical protein